jgi:hypothetical protein
MDLIAASIANILLEYTVPVLDDTYIIAAHIFATPDGIVIADAGWGGDSFGCCSSHPFHRITGAIRGDGPEWTVGHACIRQADTQTQVWRLYTEFCALRKVRGKPVRNVPPLYES